MPSLKIENMMLDYYSKTPVRNIEMLQRLANVLHNHPEKIDMSNWVNIPQSVLEAYQIDPLQMDLLGTDEYDDICGTSRCAAGWGVHFSPDFTEPTIDQYAHSWSPNSVMPVHVESGEELDWRDAGALVFGLTFAECDNLFFRRDNEILGLVNDLIAGKNIIRDDYVPGEGWREVERQYAAKVAGLEWTPWPLVSSMPEVSAS